MPRLTSLLKGKAISIKSHLGDNYYSAAYEDVVETKIGLTNCLIVEKIEVRGEDSYFFVCWCRDDSPSMEVCSQAQD